MRKAFVIMSFSPKYQAIYEHFIKPVLEQSGFDVSRADDLSTAQNIMADIIQSICSSDLIVAEITEPNPNVYYELGITHALKIPVILLSQDIDSLPFDLRSYRVLTYSTDFVAIKTAEEKLRYLANSIGTDAAQFSSPVTDFSIPTNINPTRKSTQQYSERSGIVDYFADFDESMDEINGAMEVLSAQVQLIGEKTVQRTQFLAHANNVEKRSILRSFSMEINDYASISDRACRDYLSAVEKFEQSTLKIFSLPERVDFFEDNDKAVSFLETVTESEEIGKASLASVIGFRDVMKNMPNLEFNFNIALDSAVEATSRVIQVMERHISILSKTKYICREIFEQIAQARPSPEQ